MRISRSDIDQTASEGTSGAIVIDETLRDLLANDLGDPDTPVKGVVTAQYDDAGLLVTGTVNSVLRLVCDRCATEIKLEVTGTVDVLLTEREDDLGAESDSIILALELTEDSIDLAPALRETLLLEVPQKLLCREDCKGICPTCGKDFNREVCSCSQTNIDARWGALLDIKEKLEQA